MHHGNCGEIMVVFKPHTSGSQLFVRSISPDAENREVHDFYPTHHGATKALLRRETFHPLIWEPACGAGDISTVLEANNYLVRSSDLYDYGFGELDVDFLHQVKTDRPRDIITNPPFKYAQDFVEHALSLTQGKVAMFLRLAFLESIARKTFFERSPPATVYIMSRRVPMWRGEVSDKSSSMMAMAWFVWDKHHKGDATIKWIDWKSRV